MVMPSNLLTRSMMPLLILREFRLLLEVSPSEIQPWELGEASGNVMNVGEDRVLSGANSSKSWGPAISLGRLTWFFLNMTLTGPPYICW